MAFLDKLKEGFRRATDQAKWLESVYNEAPSDENYDAWKTMLRERDFIRTQLPQFGFSLELEANKNTQVISAFKCGFCGNIFEIDQACEKHILDKHVVLLVSEPITEPV